MHSVQLGELGIFSAYINGDPADTAKEVTSQNIKNVKMVFRPGTMMKAGLKNAHFTKKERGKASNYFKCISA